MNGSPQGLPQIQGAGESVDAWDVTVPCGWFPRVRALRPGQLCAHECLSGCGPDSLCPSQADRALWTVQSRRTPPGSAGCRAGPPEPAAPRAGPALRVCGQRRPRLCALLHASPRCGQVGRPVQFPRLQVPGDPKGGPGGWAGLWRGRARCGLTTVGPQLGRGGPLARGGRPCPPLPFRTAHSVAMASLVPRRLCSGLSRTLLKPEQVANN